MTNLLGLTDAKATSVDSMNSTTSRSLLDRIQGEYREMPGLTLTLPQAARLWALGVRQAEQLLFELVRRGFLMRNGKGAYRRPGCPRCS